MTTRRKLWEPVPGISTHILTKRMTYASVVKKKWGDISTHILTKRMTGLNHPLWLHWYISTHILTKRMTPRNTKSFSNGRYFNSHPHEEDDRRYVCRCECCPIFQLTSSRGGWQNLMKQGKITEVFQLTSSRRGWQSLTYRNSAVLLFQLTSSRRGWLSLNVNSQQASLFQLTSSRRGWQKMFDFLFQDRNISTHILTKRMTVHPLLSVQLRQYFNSHPHEEDDFISAYVSMYTSFQLTSSRRGWLRENLQLEDANSFQLTSSRRGWPSKVL